MESDVVTLQDVFLAKPPDEDAASTGAPVKLLTRSAASGLKPHFLEKMAANGVALPPNFFEQEDTAPRAFSAGSFGSFA